MCVQYILWLKQKNQKALDNFQIFISSQFVPPKNNLSKSIDSQEYYY